MDSMTGYSLQYDIGGKYPMGCGLYEYWTMCLLVLPRRLMLVEGN